MSVINLQPKTVAWSKSKEKKAKRKKQKDFKAKKRQRSNDDDDDEDFANDIRLMKKLKTGKVYCVLLSILMSNAVKFISARKTCSSPLTVVLIQLQWVL